MGIRFLRSDRDCNRDPTLYRKLTGRESLELFASLHRATTRDPLELPERVNIAEAADRRVSAYSKGMRMRLNFVRALLHDPELLFLDESTAGIDPGNARAVKAVIDELHQREKTVFLTTHDMTVADDLCDRVGFIVDGTLMKIDAPRTLKLECGEPTVRIEYRDDGGLVEQTFPLTDLGDDEAFHDLLRGGQIETIHTAEATLKDVFILTPSYQYEYERRRSVRLYLRDPVLAGALADADTSEMLTQEAERQLTRTVVFDHLKRLAFYYHRSNAPVHFWESGSEAVDFVIETGEGNPLPIVTPDETLNHSASGRLDAFYDEHDCEFGITVARDAEVSIEDRTATLPLWMFLLSI